ncbi:coiled-coil domain-containing protein 112 [Rhynchocyon petersi]
MCAHTHSQNESLHKQATVHTDSSLHAFFCSLSVLHNPGFQAPLHFFRPHPTPHPGSPRGSAPSAAGRISYPHPTQLGSHPQIRSPRSQLGFPSHTNLPTRIPPTAARTRTQSPVPRYSPSRRCPAPRIPRPAPDSSAPPRRAPLRSPAPPAPPPASCWGELGGGGRRLQGGPCRPRTSRPGGRSRSAVSTRKDGRPDDCRGGGSGHCGRWGCGGGGHPRGPGRGSGSGAATGKPRSGAAGAGGVGSGGLPALEAGLAAHRPLNRCSPGALAGPGSCRPCALSAAGCTLNSLRCGPSLRWERSWRRGPEWKSWLCHSEPCHLRGINDGNFSALGGIRTFQLQNWKQKAIRTKKTEFVRTAEKLKTQVINLEKDKHSHFYNQKNDFRVEYSMLEELENKLIISRKTEREKIQQQLAKIHNNVKRLQHQLKDVKPTPDFVEKLREMMEEIENAINTFKEEQRLIYEELIKEEKTTNNELSAISRKMELWALGNSETERAFQIMANKVPIDKVASNTLPEEVVEFEKFLQQTGGRQGGWDDYDHQNFLKVRNKYKGKPVFMDEVLEHLPGKTQDDVQQHEKWYQKFLTLEERKKESIKKWKTKQQQKKEEIFKVKEKIDDVPISYLNKQEENQKQKEEERKKQKLAVEAWKKQKSIELSMKTAAQLRAEEEKERKRQKEHQHQCKRKLLLENYSQQKKEQEEFLRLEKEIREKAEKAEKRKTAAAEISRFQERDLHKLELKVLDRQVKEDEKTEKQRRWAKLKEKVENNVSRDPSRLYKPTKGWEERIKKIGPTGSGPLLYIPHRAIPSWRQGL